MDLLDDILGTLALKGVLYFRTDFSAPWAVTVPDLAPAARFHLVIEGRCHVKLATGTQVDLGPGDLVMIPKGRSHVIADSPGREAPPLETVLDAAGYDGRGFLAVGDGNREAATQLICGHLSFRDGADHPILRALPDLVVITAAMRAGEPWLDDMLRLITRRMFADQMGSTASVTRLSEIVFIEVLRTGLARSGTISSMMEAFRDRQIGGALELMHGEPDRPWTVETLASTVGMSRSRFADRFKDLVGVGPMSYLTDWRLQKALALLDETQSSIKQVAGKAGYRSQAAFARAFADKFGVAPTEYRRNLH